MENLRRSVIILAMVSILFMLFSCSKDEIEDNTSGDCGVITALHENNSNCDEGFGITIITNDNIGIFRCVSEAAFIELSIGENYCYSTTIIN